MSLPNAEAISDSVRFGYRLDALVDYPLNDGFFAQGKRNDFSVLIVRAVQDVGLHIEEKTAVAKSVNIALNYFVAVKGARPGEDEALYGSALYASSAADFNAFDEVLRLGFVVRPLGFW